MDNAFYDELGGSMASDDYQAVNAATENPGDAPGGA